MKKILLYILILLGIYNIGNAWLIYYYEPYVDTWLIINVCSDNWYENNWYVYNTNLYTYWNGFDRFNILYSCWLYSFTWSNSNYLIRRLNNIWEAHTTNALINLNWTFYPWTFYDYISQIIKAKHLYYNSWWYLWEVDLWNDTSKIITTSNYYIINNNIWKWRIQEGNNYYYWSYTLTGWYKQLLYTWQYTVWNIIGDWLGISYFTWTWFVIFRVWDPGKWEPEVVRETAQGICSTYPGSYNICMYYTGGIIYTYILNTGNLIIDSGAIAPSVINNFWKLIYEHLTYDKNTSKLLTYTIWNSYWEWYYQTIEVLQIQHPPSWVPTYDTNYFYMLWWWDTNNWWWDTNIIIGTGDNIFGTVNCDSDWDWQVGIVEAITCVDDYISAYIIQPIVYPYNSIVNNGKNIIDKLKNSCVIDLDTNKKTILSWNNVMFTWLFNLDNNTIIIFNIIKYILIVVLYLLTIYLFLKR